VSVTHEEHEAITLPAGRWEVRRQREYTPGQRQQGQPDNSISYVTIDVPTPAELNEFRDRPPSVHPRGIEAAMKRLCEGWRLGAWRMRWFDDAVSALGYIAQHPDGPAETAEPPYRRFATLGYDEACERLHEGRIGSYILGNVAPWEGLQTWYQMDQQVLSACLPLATAPIEGEQDEGSGRRDGGTEQRLIDTAVHSHVEACLALKSGYDEGWLLRHWRALIEAFQAGLWCYWVCGEEIIVVPRPILRTRNGQLHCETGPAAAWPEGPGLWFLQGVEVSEQLVLAPETLTPDEILSESNVELRRIMIERFGMERLVREAEAEVVHTTDEGTLYRVPLTHGIEDDDEWLAALEVTCPSTGRTFLLGVPPWMRGVREAIAWTFGMRSREYRPVRET